MSEHGVLPVLWPIHGDGVLARRGDLVLLIHPCEHTLIGVIKDSVKRAGVSRTSATRDLQVASVKLILDVVATATAGGEVDFCVPFIGMKLRVGAKVTKKDTHTIEITLVPPKDRDTRQVRGGEVQDVLVNAITTIRDVMAKAAEGDDPWLREAGTVNISPSPSRRPEPSRSESTANWLTSSPTPCASGWLRSQCEKAAGSIVVCHTAGDPGRSGAFRLA